MDKLTPVVSEEWNHFEQVLRKLRARGWTLGESRKDEYVEKLRSIVKTGGSQEEQLVEKLLMNTPH